MELPFVFSGNDYPFLAVYLQATRPLPLYASFSNDVNQYSKIMTLSANSAIGKVISFEHNQHANIFVIDELSCCVVSCPGFLNSVTPGWNLALWGEEIISFSKWQQLDEDLYKIFSLVRGQYTTENELAVHSNNQNFVLLAAGVNLLTLAATLEQKLIYFKVGQEIITKLFANKSQKLPPPYINHCVFSEQSLCLSWQARQRIGEGDGWGAYEALKISFVINIASDDNSYQFIVTSEDYLTIDLNTISLSDKVKIAIVMKYENGSCSLPATIIAIKIKTR